MKFAQCIKANLAATELTAETDRTVATQKVQLKSLTGTPLD